ncbi:unnamed protein product [Rotaria socialis]|uniref:HAT C-terminal dimerisation domain-containing protein n=1 Tax=Rotaria socialis TaxID=392032 RepID=A0A820ZVH8_9BILA|nr:unnamed protein product [Rotaria socialis]CAF4568880.1 unnamed protein product [Rotaria socialis]
MKLSDNYAFMKGHHMNYRKISNPLIFWRDQQKVLPILSKTAKSVFVIQAPSAESERHFSIAGQVVTEQRSQLEPECLESPVVLKEAYLNKTWPK